MENHRNQKITESDIKKESNSEKKIRISRRSFEVSSVIRK